MTVKVKKFDLKDKLFFKNEKKKKKKIIKINYDKEKKNTK